MSQDCVHDICIVNRELILLAIDYSIFIGLYYFISNSADGGERELTSFGPLVEINVYDPYLKNLRTCDV